MFCNCAFLKIIIKQLVQRDLLILYTTTSEFELMFCANATKVPAFLWLLGAGSQISSTFTDKTQYNTIWLVLPTPPVTAQVKAERSATKRTS